MPRLDGAAPAAQKSLEPYILRRMLPALTGESVLCAFRHGTGHGLVLLAGPAAYCIFIPVKENIKVRM